MSLYKPVSISGIVCYQYHKMLITALLVVHIMRKILHGKKAAFGSVFIKAAFRPNILLCSTKLISTFQPWSVLPAQGRMYDAIQAKCMHHVVMIIIISSSSPSPNQQPGHLFAYRRRAVNKYIHTFKSNFVYNFQTSKKTETVCICIFKGCLKTFNFSHSHNHEKIMIYNNSNMSTEYLFDASYFLVALFPSQTQSQPNFELTHKYSHRGTTPPPPYHRLKYTHN